MKKVKKEDAKKVTEVTISEGVKAGGTAKSKGEKVLVFKAIRPLGEREFKLLSEMVRYEEKKAGVEIVLMPYSCELKE